MSRMIALFAAVFLNYQLAAAEVVEKRIEYHDGNTPLIGSLFTDSAMEGKVPGVLVFSDWLGAGPFAKERARGLVKLGYAAFVADVYGEGRLAKSPEEAGELATKLKSDRALMRRRARLAFDSLLASGPVDPAKIGAIGFCFGGTVGLELARDGAPLAGTVSFHGGLDTPNPADAKKIRGKVLALHGADDTFVPESEVKDFEKEMTAAGVVWELVKYSQSVHAFTNPAAGHDNSKGAAYNERSARRAYRAMEDFFKEVL